MITVQKGNNNSAIYILFLFSILFLLFSGESRANEFDSSDDVSSNSGSRSIIMKEKAPDNGTQSIIMKKGEEQELNQEQEPPNNTSISGKSLFIGLDELSGRPVDLSDSSEDSLPSTEQDSWSDYTEEEQTEEESTDEQMNGNNQEEADENQWDSTDVAYQSQ